jgi:serine/threonine-protein kinase HipA
VSRELTVLLGGRVVGQLSQGEGGALSFAYDDAYRDSPSAVPVSLSMPLTDQIHPDRVVRAFCQGLLPDNEGVLERWGREFHVSPGNPFALLSHVGEDCAGAVVFVPPERVDAMVARVGAIAPLTEERVAQRLRQLRRDPLAGAVGRRGPGARRRLPPAVGG